MQTLSWIDKEVVIKHRIDALFSVFESVATLCSSHFKDLVIYVAVKCIGKREGITFNPSIYARTT